MPVTGFPTTLRNNYGSAPLAELLTAAYRKSPTYAHHLWFAQSKGLGFKVSDEFTVPLWQSTINRTMPRAVRASGGRSTRLNHSLWLSACGEKASRCERQSNNPSRIRLRRRSVSVRHLLLGMGAGIAHMLD